MRGKKSAWFFFIYAENILNLIVEKYLNLIQSVEANLHV